MTHIVKIQVGNDIYMFLNHSENTRTGFKHVSELYSKKGRFIPFHCLDRVEIPKSKIYWFFGCRYAEGAGLYD